MTRLSREGRYYTHPTQPHITPSEFKKMMKTRDFTTANREPWSNYKAKILYREGKKYIFLICWGPATQ